MALFMALRIQFGLAANIKPSSTNRMPKPMRKSANAMDLIGLEPPLVLLFALRGGIAAARSSIVSGLRRLRRLRSRLAAGRATEIPEEVRFGPQQIASVAGAQAGLVGRHRAVEGEEARILAVGFGKQPVPFGVARTAGQFGLRVCFGNDHGDVAIGLGANLL